MGALRGKSTRQINEEPAASESQVVLFNTLMKKHFSRFWLVPLRTVSSVWRFRTLQLAESAFCNVQPETILARRFYSQRLFIDVSRSNVQKLLYFEGPRFIKERQLLESLVPSGGHTVDVGANIGYYTLLFHRFV